jgi:hypothetical protein
VITERDMKSIKLKIKKIKILRTERESAAEVEAIAGGKVEEIAEIDTVAAAKAEVIIKETESLDLNLSRDPERDIPIDLDLSLLIKDPSSRMIRVLTI